MAYVEAVSSGTDPTTGFRTRSNAVRSGYFARNRVVVSLNGTIRQGVIKSSIRIDERMGSEPCTADLMLKGGAGYVPDRGHEVIIGHGTTDNRLFGGRVVRARRFAARHVETKPTYTLEMADHAAFDLKSTPASVFQVTSLSVRSILLGLIAATTPSVGSMGLQATYIEEGLPALAAFDVSPAEMFGDAVDRLADTIGASWYYDYTRRLHFWVEADPQPRPTINTLTGTSPGFWDLTREVDLSRCVSRVVGLGQSTEVAADCWSTSRQFPILSADPIADDPKADYIGSATDMVLVNGVPRTSVRVQFAQQLVNGEAISKASPVSLQAGFLWVGEMASSISAGGYMLDRTWWADGAYTWQVQSLNQISITANTIYQNFYVPSSGPGAPPATTLGVLAAGHPLTTAQYYELQVASIGIFPGGYVVPKGAPVRAYYTAVNSASYAAIQTMCGNTMYGLLTGVVEGDYRPTELRAACDAVLEDGQPDNWQTLEFKTRQTDYTRGQRLYVSITGSGESGGPTIAGSFAVQEVTIEDVDDTSEALGPVRRVVARPVRRPNLWRVLRLNAARETRKK